MICVFLSICRIMGDLTLIYYNVIQVHKGLICLNKENYEQIWDGMELPISDTYITYTPNTLLTLHTVHTVHTLHTLQTLHTLHTLHNINYITYIT